MGIQDLRPFIKKYSPNIVKEIHIKELAGTKISFDIMCFIYKYIRGGDTNHHWIERMIQTLSIFTKHRVDVVCVFDGKDTPFEKEAERARRRDAMKPNFDKIIKAQSIVEKIKQGNGPIIDSELIKEVEGILSKQREIKGHSSMNFKVRSTIVWVLNESIAKWEKQTVFATDEHISIAKDLCRILHIPIYQAKGEGETACACLCLSGNIDTVYTEDTDIFVYGCPMQIYGLDERRETVKIMYLKDVLEDLNLQFDQFRDMCIMFGCDYNQRVPGVGAQMAYNLISQCDFIEGILETDPMSFSDKRTRTACIKVQEGYEILNHEKCRKLFSYRRVAKVKWPAYKPISHPPFNAFLKKNDIYSKYVNAETLLTGVWKPTPMEFLEYHL